MEEIHVYDIIIHKNVTYIFFEKQKQTKRLPSGTQNVQNV